MPDGYWKLVEAAAARSDFRPTLSFWKSLWPALVGDEIASHSVPCGWHGKTLIVEVEKGGWEYAVGKSKPAIMRKLRELPWPVKNLELQPGHVQTYHEPRFDIRDLDQVELPDDALGVLHDSELDSDLADLAVRIRKHLEWEKKSR